LIVGAEAFAMPTNLPPSEHDPRSGPNVAAIVVVVALVLGCLWLFHALSSANSKLNCVASGRHNCDQADQ
jgi:hypothetical protein